MRSFIRMAHAPGVVESGVDQEVILTGGCGHTLEVWDLATRRRLTTLDLGAEHRILPGLRPVHRAAEPYGFVGVLTSFADCSASVWMWHRRVIEDTLDWAVRKVIDIPAEPAAADELPAPLKELGVVPPLITDLKLTLDDDILYVACWGAGEVRQYDVRNPFEPKLSGRLRIGGITRRQPHPSRPDLVVNGGPQTVDVSGDGRRVYVTNSPYAAPGSQVEPGASLGWMARVDTAAKTMRFDERFLLDCSKVRQQVYLAEIA